MAQLADFIEARREEITQRWVEQLFATDVPPTLDREEVIDSLREYLDELVRRLREEQGFHQHTHTAKPSSFAKGHGKQRFGMGYDIGGLAREYGLLRDVLFQLIEEHGVSPGLRELRVLSKYLVNAIADAVSQYSLERDEELRQLAARHVGFLAHELRNPLASARLALEMLERGMQERSRPAQLLERSLARLNELIDNALIEARLRGIPAPEREPIELSELLNTIAEESGAGLPENRMQTLFDPFVQVGKDRSGFGLGLAIAKQAAEAHEGELRVHNLPGKGCVFVLDIPVNPSPPSV